MILAAYMVVGFLVASIYAVGMLKGRRDRLHRLGLLIPLTIGLIATPIQLFVGDTAARAVADNQPAKFAGMECIEKSGDAPDRVPRRHLHLGRGQGRDPDPRPRLLPGRLQRRHRGHRARGDPRRRTAARQHPAAPRLRHDGRDRLAAAPARRLGRLRWWRRRDIPQTPWFLRAVAVSGGGRGARALVRLDRHRGRAPAVDRAGLHADRRSGDRGERDLVQPSRSCCCSTRRWGRSRSSSCAGCRGAGARAGPTNRAGEAPLRSPLTKGGTRMSRGRRRRGDPLDRRDLLRALRRGRLRRRLLGPRRRRRRDGRAAAGPDPALADAGLGGQPRLADLHPRRPLDRLPRRLQRGDDDALRAAGAGRARDRPARRGLRLPQVDRGLSGAARRGRHVRALLGPDAVLHGRRRRRDRRRQRPGRGRTATPSRAGSSRCRC